MEASYHHILVLTNSRATLEAWCKNPENPVRRIFQCSDESSEMLMMILLPGKYLSIRQQLCQSGL